MTWTGHQRRSPAGDVKVAHQHDDVDSEDSFSALAHPFLLYLSAAMASTLLSRPTVSRAHAVRTTKVRFPQGGEACPGVRLLALSPEPDPGAQQPVPGLDPPSCAPLGLRRHQRTVCSAVTPRPVASKAANAAVAGALALVLAGTPSAALAASCVSNPTGAR